MSYENCIRSVRNKQMASGGWGISVPTQHRTTTTAHTASASASANITKHLQLLVPCLAHPILEGAKSWPIPSEFRKLRAVVINLN
ncbi:unnamed protein product [Protopolystoma xenopodis]|uniref:Uncharacterized protein n=1 Tax=Protopolystoma xenopodis TaxID=117903 RepID=A0A448WYE9_9PLAT|nr:unnamed protein product [Protopolystoma xenopodis]